MISVIICSKSPAFFDAISLNIANTIGVEYEVVKIDNSDNRYSICKAYNEGAAKSRYPYLCFVHEDVLFQTKDWGSKIINHFEEDNNIGLLGVAGSVYKSKMSTAWWQSEEDWAEMRRMNIIQHYKNSQHSAKSLFVNPLNETRSLVVALDGVMLVTKREIWQQYKFDEKLLKGFHGYDLDYCFQVLQAKKVVVIYDVLIDHFSGGNSDGNWLTEILKVHKKWKKHLPLFIEDCQPNNGVVYVNGLKRLRKQMNILVKENHNVFFLLKSYNDFFSFLDKRPNAFKVLKDYFKELGKIIRLKYAAS